MPERTDQPAGQHSPAPVDLDATASPAELQQRAAQDLAAQQAAAKAKQAQGGTGTRQGILPSGGGH